MGDSHYMPHGPCCVSLRQAITAHSSMYQSKVEWNFIFSQSNLMYLQYKYCLVTQFSINMYGILLLLVPVKLQKRCPSHFQ